MLAVLVSFVPDVVQATEFHVATDGNDADNGSISAPFLTVTKAASMAGPGDSIFMHSGSYPYQSWIACDGTQASPIVIEPYEDGSVVFDGDLVSGGLENANMYIVGDWVVFRNMELQNGYNGLILKESAAHVLIENVRSHDNYFSGFALMEGVSYIRLVNCDAYHNFDVDTHGENADGFSIKGFSDQTIYGVGPGIELVNCRAWGNSDDGFDFWDAGNAITVRGCWSFENGFDLWDHGPAFTGNGMGFKMGRSNPDSPQDAHVMIRCVAWGNYRYGFDYNSNVNSLLLINNTSVDNRCNFLMRDVAHRMINNISAMPSLDPDDFAPDVVYQTNSWNILAEGSSLYEQQFASLDDTIAKGPRNPDGTLPDSDFLHLEPDSLFVDAGTDPGDQYGLQWEGSPDIGAFEYIETAGTSTSTSSGDSGTSMKCKWTSTGSVLPVVFALVAGIRIRRKQYICQ